MKEQILELRQAGKSYKEICQTLGCSKSTVAYHCGKGQKEKTQDRQRVRRKDLVILKKVENFQHDRKIGVKTEDFQRDRLVNSGKGPTLGKRHLTFRWQDVIEKFGWETTCYLTGRKINLRHPKTYQFDHVVPVAKGGSSTLDNLGICCRNANHAKYDMSVDEFLNLCKEVLEHHGYKMLV